jgi:hypothetical protein
MLYQALSLVLAPYITPTPILVRTFISTLIHTHIHPNGIHHQIHINTAPFRLPPATPIINAIAHHHHSILMR